MNRKLLTFWDQICSLVQYARIKTYRQILGLILLALLGLISIISVPVLSAQQIEVTSGAISATSNAQLLLQQGIKLFEAENFAEAVLIWQKAASTFAVQKNNLSLALVLSNLSSAYQELGQWKEAEAAITQSLNLLKNLENLTDSQTYLEIHAKALNNQGSLKWAKGQLDAALFSWKEATTTYKKAGNKTGIIGSLINQSQALQALGDSRKAEKTLEKVDEILKQESNPSLKATWLRNLGSARRRVGKLEDARQDLAASLQLAERPTAKSLSLLELGNTERALANRAVARRKRDDEEKHYRTAVEFYQQAAMNSDSAGQLPALLNQLSLLVEMGQRSDVRKLLPDIQKAIASLPASRTAIYARLNFAQSLTCLQSDIDIKAISCIKNDRAKQPNEQLSTQGLPSRQEIAQILATAVQQARSLQDLRAESFALGQLGELYEISQQQRAAQTLTEQAILRLEEIQAPDIRYRWEWQLGRLLEQQGDTKGAISTYMTAVETLKSVRGNLLTINPDVQFSFRDNVEPIYRNLVDLLLRTDGASEPSQDNLKLAVDNIDSLQLAELENFLGCNLSTVQLNQDIDQVDPKAAFIYPIILEDRLEVIFRLPGQPLRHHTSPVRRTDVEKTLKKLRTALLTSNGGKVKENSKLVYQWLIEPIEKDLEKNSKIETLVFALDGELRNIPMAVLYDSKVNKYLIEKEYTVVLLPSSKLFDLQARAKKIKVLGAGISEELKYENLRFTALNVTRELEQIKKIISSKILLNSEFTQPNIQQNINSGAFSIIHLATHGKFSSDPEETYILIHSSEGSTGELLKAKDLDILLRSSNKASGNLELLVLSACKTAEGDNRATLGLAGLAVRAGSRSTLATLWQVNDKSTVQLMEQFYKELNKPGVTKAAALHRAQQALSRDKNNQNPSDWAPYILVGNWL